MKFNRVRIKNYDAHSECERQFYYYSGSNDLKVVKPYVKSIQLQVCTSRRRRAKYIDAGVLLVDWMDSKTSATLSW